MALVTKTFSTTCYGDLLDAVNADVAIGVACSQIIQNGGPTIDFDFATALTGPQDTALDALLAGWACPAPIDDANITATNVADHQMLTYDLATASWVNENYPTVGSLDDTTLTAPADGQSLVYQSGVWVNQTIGGGGGTPGGVDSNVQYNNGGAFGGEANFSYDDTAKRVDIAGIDETVQLAVGGNAADPGGILYIEVNASGEIEGMRTYFNRGAAGINGWITYSYDGATPYIRVIDEDDDPSRISFDAIGSGTYAIPQFQNAFGGRGATANATTGFKWTVNGTTISEMDSNFFLLPTGNQPGTPANGMLVYNTTTDKFEGYENGAWVELVGGGGGGESNTASNLGAGTGVFAQKSGVDLEFKSLVGGTNVTITSTGTEITINSTGGGGGSPADQVSVTAVRTTTQNITATYADLAFDTTPVENDDTIIEHTATDRITVKETGLYQVSYSMDGQENVLARVRINDTLVIPGSSHGGGLTSNQGAGYFNSSAVFTVELTANDYLTVQVAESASQGTSVLAGAVWTVNRMAAVQGNPGTPGADGQDGADGAVAVLQDEGVALGGAPHTTYNFVGAGVSTTDAGSNVATITIPGSGPGNSGIEFVEDEGSAIAGTPHDTINFVGTGVTATDGGGGTVDVTIPGTSLQMVSRTNGATVQTWTTTPTTILFNTNERTDAAYTYSAGEVTFNTAGWYRVDVNVAVDEAAGNNRSDVRGYLEIDTGGGFALVDGSNAYAYSRNASQGTGTLVAHKLIQVDVGDVIRFMSVRNSGNSTFTTMNNGSQLTIEKRD